MSTDDLGIRIGDRRIGPGSRPFVVAELSGNHNGNLERALEVVDAAARSGADAVKLQTYTPDSMTLNVNYPDFTVKDPSSLWFGRTLYELYGEAATPYQWHEPIFERCRRYGMLAFSSPFDPAAVAFLDDLGVPCFKIASFEIVDHELIRCAAATGKPLIISTGLATIQEIADAIAVARSAGCSEIVLLKCTSEYPADPADANLRTIEHMRALFRCEVGLSDHTPGIGVSVAAIALGATVIEKHVTLRRSDGGVEFGLLNRTSRARVACGGSSASARGVGDDNLRACRPRRGIAHLSEVPLHYGGYRRRRAPDAPECSGDPPG